MPGLAIVACGVSHVKSTAEVGYIHLKRENACKKLERTRITLVDPTPCKEIFTQYALHAFNALHFAIN